jgi:hypothetical protein
MGETKVATGQIRVRKDGASQIATARRARVGHEHATLCNVFQLYDADTGKPCGGWSAYGIAEDYPTVENAQTAFGDRVWAPPSGQTLLTRDGSTLRAWACMSSGNTSELRGEERTNVIEAWGVAERARAENAEREAGLALALARAAQEREAHLIDSVGRMTVALASMEKTLRATEAERDACKLIQDNLEADLKRAREERREARDAGEAIAGSLRAELADMMKRRDGWERATRSAEADLDKIANVAGRRRGETTVEAVERIVADPADFHAVHRGQP